MNPNRRVHIENMKYIKSILDSKTEEISSLKDNIKKLEVQLNSKSEKISSLKVKVSQNKQDKKKDLDQIKKTEVLGNETYYTVRKNSIFIETLCKADKIN